MHQEADRPAHLTPGITHRQLRVLVDDCEASTQQSQRGLESKYAQSQRALELASSAEVVVEMAQHRLQRIPIGSVRLAREWMNATVDARDGQPRAQRYTPEFDVHFE